MIFANLTRFRVPNTLIKSPKTALCLFVIQRFGLLAFWPFILPIHEAEAGGEGEAEEDCRRAVMRLGSA